jgi:hypothetical protein
VSLPSPKLDDRTYDELRNQLINQIPARCPRWTDFNPSDPGITVLELMAWLAEVLLYRINRIPEKSLIRFLELIGVQLHPPGCAHTWVVFTAAATQEGTAPFIPRGTRLSASSDGAEPIAFETTKDLNLTTAKVIKVLSAGDDITDQLSLSPSALTDDRGAAIFDHPDNRHILYIGDSRLADCPRGTLVHLGIGLERPMAGPVQVEWEVKEREAWVPLLPLSDETLGLRQGGEVRFVAEKPFVESEVAQIKSNWLRLRLIGDVSVSSQQRHLEMPLITGIELGLERPAEQAEAPARIYVSARVYISARLRVEVQETMRAGPDRLPHEPVDPHSQFYLFGRIPQPGNAVYIASPLFGRTQSRFIVQFSMMEELSLPSSGGPGDLLLHWEYFTQTGRWELLGISGRQGTVGTDFELQDRTNALTRSDSVTFRRPDAMAQTLLLGELQWTIRCRIAEGDYGGETGQPLQCQSVGIRFVDIPRPVEHAVAQTGVSERVLSTEPRQGRPITPFQLEHASQPEIALAFDIKMNDVEQCLLFDLAEHRKIDRLPLLWEYSGEHGWRHLNVLEDGTRAMSETGALIFLAPRDWRATTIAGTHAFWLRGRLQLGTYLPPPRLRALYLNAVEAIQKRHVEGEILGSSTGEPRQSFTLRYRPLLAAPKIFVKEKASDGGEAPKPEWVEWDGVDYLLSSRPSDRHFAADLRLGTVTFGDARHGMIPPRLANNIRADYQVGGGVLGNVSKGSITAVDTDLPGITVTNVMPARGGTEGETIEEAELRGPATLKHRDRAVTCEDYERLALEATREVAKAYCFPEPGGVELLIVPRAEGGTPRPSGHLVRRVAAYLDARRIITTRLCISGPRYEEIQLRAEVALQPSHMASFAVVRADCERRLQALVDPLHGGADGTGWPLGRAVHSSEIYRLLLQMPQIDHASTVLLRKSGDRSWREIVEVDKRAYPTFDLQSSEIHQV